MRMAWTLLLAYAVCGPVFAADVEFAAKGGQISRIGMKVPIKGTELPMRPNPYGRRAEKLNALAFARTARRPFDSAWRITIRRGF